MQVYCDTAATTKPYMEVLDAVVDTMDAFYGNPSSEYSIGTSAADMLRKARHSIAADLGAKDSEIYFTSGASEANNWAIRGAVEAGKKDGKVFVITSEFEHHSVLNTLKALSESDDVHPLYVRPDKDGYVDPADVAKLLDEYAGKVALVSIMAVNNEIGTIQPIRTIASICQEHGVWFHVDATQAIGHMDIDVSAYGMDMMSFSGHKFHGPRGIGALYIRSGVKIPNLIYGGKQERGSRAGTENLPGIVGMATALDLCKKSLNDDIECLEEVRDKIAKELLTVDGAHLNGSLMAHAPGILNFTFDGVEGESLLLMLDSYGICVSAGSACATGSLEPSHVLRAIGLTRVQAMCSIRISFDEFITDAEVDYVIDTIKKCVTILRGAV